MLFFSTFMSLSKYKKGVTIVSKHKTVIVLPYYSFSCSSLQVCQFVVAVNGMNVLSLDYRTVSNLILTGPRTVVMEVMEEGEY